MNTLKKEKAFTTKDVVSLLVALAIYFICFLVTPPEGLTHEGLTAVGLLVGTVVLWATGAIPMGIASVMMMFFVWIFKLYPMGQVAGYFWNPMLFFMLPMFCLAAIMLDTNLAKRIVGKVVGWSGTNPKKVVWGFMFAALIVSSFMSCIPTIAMFAGLALVLLKANHSDKPGISNLGKCLMIIIPVGASLGNLVTPAGNAINALVIGGLQSVANISLGFLQWTVFGLPIAIVGALFCGFWILKCFPPEPLTQEAVDQVISETKSLGPLDAQEKKFLVIMIAMIACWFAGTWVKWLGMVDVAVVGLLLFFMPGINLLNGPKFIKAVPWDMMLMAGGVLAMGSIIQETGAITWVVENAMSGAGDWSMLMLVVLMSLIPCIIHIFVPAAGAIYALCGIPLIGMAVSIGLNPLIPAFIVGAWINMEYVLPTDSTYLLTLGYGYYQFKDTVKFGVVTTVVMLIIACAWIPVAAGILL